MTEKQLVKAVEYFLCNVGLNPTTVPAVMINNRTPSLGEQQKLEELQRFLRRYDLVQDVPMSDIEYIPGGWQRVQISDKGYRIRTYELHTIANLVGEELDRQYAEKRSLGVKATRVPRKPVIRDYTDVYHRRGDDDHIDDNEGYPPNWWFRLGGESFCDYYDPDYEQPAWWAKYRLRRKMALQLDPDDFPVTNKEKICDYFFTKTSPGSRFFIITTLISMTLFLLLTWYDVL